MKLLMHSVLYSMFENKLKDEDMKHNQLLSNLRCNIQTKLKLQSMVQLLKCIEPIAKTTKHYLNKLLHRVHVTEISQQLSKQWKKHAITKQGMVSHSKESKSINSKSTQRVSIAY